MKYEKKKYNQKNAWEEFVKQEQIVSVIDRLQNFQM